MSVNVFSMKVLIGATIFMSPNGDRTANLRDEGLATCSAKGVPSLLSYFKTLSTSQAPGMEPATSRSAVNRPTN